ncbi:MAG: SEC-C domain-containing protein [Acidobacteria bacterium]|nr:SEC-C domain-containing protein [Acidobacteriota bacterium]
MNKKTGRNDPCPCGSGKKYKKCCGADLSEGGFVQTPEDWFPPSERTGTLWDEYMDLIPIFAIYGKKIMQFEKDGKAFEKAVSDFEKHFCPGEQDGITDSFFMSWKHFDFRFGPSLETVGDRILADPMMAGLNEPGPTYIRHLNESYLTFYAIIEDLAKEDMAIVEELGTGERFTILHVRELLDIEPVVGEIWFARRVGFPDRSIFYTTPYVFDQETRSEFRRVVKKQEEDFSRSSKAGLFPADRHFAESQKEAARFWAWYILEGWREDSSPITDEAVDLEDDLERAPFPLLVTTDGEELILTEIHFRIRDEAAVRKHLSSLRSISYDKKNDSWTWLKAKSRKYPDKPRTVLGHFRIEGGHLIAETNSRDRASRLRSKLKGHLGNLIAYDKTLYREPTDFPELSPEESAALRKKSDELNAIPEIQDAIRKQLEHHYFEEWPSAKIPALGGKTPLQAVKKEEGRRKVIALIDDIERMQVVSKSTMPKIDFDRLRRRLGLPPKAN